MNLLYLSGFLKSFNLLVLAVFLASFHSGRKDTGTLTVKVRNVNGDTVLHVLGSKLILTVINEPACTGCKVDLLKEMHRKKKINQLYMLDWTPGIVQRKNYRNYIRKLHGSATDMYSLSNDVNRVVVNDSVITLTKEPSPYQLWVYNVGDSVRVKKVTYREIFESRYIREEYLDLLDEF